MNSMKIACLFLVLSIVLINEAYGQHGGGHGGHGHGHHGGGHHGEHGGHSGEHQHSSEEHHHEEHEHTSEATKAPEPESTKGSEPTKKPSILDKIKDKLDEKKQA